MISRGELLINLSKINALQGWIPTLGKKIKLQKASKRPDGWADRCTDGRTSRWTEGQTDGWTDKQTDGWADGRKDKQIDGRMDRWTDILYCHSGYLTLWHTAICTARNYRTHKLSPKIDAYKQTERQIERDAYRPTYRYISSTGPHWVPLDPSAGINASRRWTPTLEINRNTKWQKSRG